MEHHGGSVGHVLIDLQPQKCGHWSEAAAAWLAFRGVCPSRKLSVINWDEYKFCSLVTFYCDQISFHFFLRK